MKALRNIKRKFDMATKADKDGLELDDFVDNFRDILGEKMTDRQLEKLFMKIDANSDGSVDWEEFSNFMLMETEGAALLTTGTGYREFLGEDTIPVPIDNVHHVHRDMINRILSIKRLGTYVTSSRDGTLRVWGQTRLNHLRTIKLPTSAWISDCTFMEPYNRVCAATMDRQLTLIDTASWDVTMSITKLPSAPLCVDWHGIEGGDNFLSVGDDSGHVSFFRNWDERLRMRPDQPGSSGDAAVRPSFEAATSKDKQFMFLREKPHDDWVTKVAYIPEAGGTISCSLEPSEKRNVAIMDMHKMKVVRRLERMEHGVYSFAWNPHYKLLAGCGMDRVIQLWNPFIRKPMGVLSGHVSSVVDIVASGQREKFGGYGWAEAKASSRLAGTEAETDNPHLFVSLGSDKTIKVWDIRTQSCLQTISDKVRRLPEDRFGAVVYDRPNGRIVTGAQSLVVLPQERYLDMSDGPRSHNRPVCRALFNRTFDVVVSGDDASVVCVWNVATGDLEFRFDKCHGTNKITAMNFDSAGRRLITGGHDGSVKVWNFNSGACIKELLPRGAPDPTDEAREELAARRQARRRTKNGRAELLAQRSKRMPWSDRRFKDAIDDAKKGMERELGGHEISAVMYVQKRVGSTTADFDTDSDGGGEDDDDDDGPDLFKCFLATGWARRIFAWEDSEQVMEPLDRMFNENNREEQHHDDIFDIAFSPPNTVATCSYDGVVMVWNVESGSLRYWAVEPDHVGKRPTDCPLHKLLFMPRKGNLLLTCGADGYVRFWRLEETKLVHVYGLHAGHQQGEPILAMAVSDDNTRLFTGDSLGEVRTFDISRIDARSQAYLSTAIVPGSTWRAHREAVHSIDSMCKYDMIVTTSSDACVKVWTTSGRIVGTFGVDQWNIHEPSSWSKAEPLVMPKPIEYTDDAQEDEDEDEEDDEDSLSDSDDSLGLSTKSFRLPPINSPATRMVPTPYSHAVYDAVNPDSPSRATKRQQPMPNFSRLHTFAISDPLPPPSTSARYRRDQPSINMESRRMKRQSSTGGSLTSRF